MIEVYMCIRKYLVINCKFYLKKEWIINVKVKYVMFDYYRKIYLINMKIYNLMIMMLSL